jgi:hypothetical protein
LIIRVVTRYKIKMDRSGKFSKQFLLIGLFILLSISNIRLAIAQANKPYDWPSITNETKPWTRWWWMGNAVNVNDLSFLMRQYKNAGLGGLEITPIYGVRGYENQFHRFLSPAWLKLLDHTLYEGKNLGLGIDLAQASGWPFGGPWVNQDDACKYMTYALYTLNSGERLKDKIIYMQRPVVITANGKLPTTKLLDPVKNNMNLQELALHQVRFQKKIPLYSLMAYSDKGHIIDLTAKVGPNGILNWQAPDGKWNLYALFEGWHGKLVERAGPGGEGDVIDHFSAKATQNYLSHFDQIFSEHRFEGIRAFFNDSYEVDDAKGQSNWTPSVVETFLKLKGYDLRNYLPALFGNDTLDKNRRVRSDYREVMAELLLKNFNSVWHKWAVDKKKIIRNQAHGAPGNLLDLYEISDIPETEGVHLINIKMASSAANTNGKKLISAEAATWENEHFTSNLAAIKKAVERFFLGGVNHIVYHGTNYSPPNEPWPGWHFYAAVELNPSNPLWTHLPALNRYITNVQSFLQSGKSDNDILFYYPIYDSFSDVGENTLLNFHDINREFPLTNFLQVAELLVAKGYAFDYISDKQIDRISVVGNQLKTGDVQYKTLVVPHVKYLPLNTLKKLLTLAEAGANVIFLKDLPSDVPGLADLRNRRLEFRQLLSELQFDQSNFNKHIKIASLGKGKVLTGDNPEMLLGAISVRNEKMFSQGLKCVRRRYDDGYYYFITNWGKEQFNGWIPINIKLSSVAIYNPMNGKSGSGQVRSKNDQNSVYLQLQPGESCIVKSFDSLYSGIPYTYHTVAGKSIEIKGNWKLEFLTGGPNLPKEMTLPFLKTWTGFPGEDVKNFSGTAKYSIDFLKPNRRSSMYRLDLGKVGESAQIILNDEVIATLIGPSFCVNIESSKFLKNNKLEIIVANLMSNRIAYLDKNNINWKKFYNINFIPLNMDNKNREGILDFSNKEPTPSGLLAPVTITPLKTINGSRM